MENKARILTVSESARSHPRIILTGAWLTRWGYTPGDRILVTKNEAGEIMIKIQMPSSQRIQKPSRPQLYAEQQLFPASDLAQMDLSATG